MLKLSNIPTVQPVWSKEPEAFRDFFYQINQTSLFSVIKYSVIAVTIKLSVSDVQASKQKTPLCSLLTTDSKYSTAVLKYSFIVANCNGILILNK